MVWALNRDAVCACGERLEWCCGEGWCPNCSYPAPRLQRDRWITARFIFCRTGE